MAELQQQPDPPITAATTILTTAVPPLTASATVPPSLDNNNISSYTNNNNNNNSNNLALQSLAPKRQRRPSVRLGEIGGDTKSWKFHKHPTTIPAKSSKLRPLTNLVNGCGPDYSEDNLDFTTRKSKSKRSVKRVRTNWTSRPLNNNGVGAVYENNEAAAAEFRDFEIDGSESPLKEQQQTTSPVHSVDNDFGRPARTNSLPESNSRDNRKCGTSNEDGDVGVRDWLIGLGLGRYAPVFEIHEVDDEVLPMLTLEDLKDMGINAVGSRRKMYSSILKLRKWFS